MNSIVLIRFLNLFFAQIFGFPGVILSACFIIVCMARKESFGVPYLMPFSPIKQESLADSLLVMPKKALSHTTNSLYGEEN